MKFIKTSILSIASTVILSGCSSTNSMSRCLGFNSNTAVNGSYDYSYLNNSGANQSDSAGALAGALILVCAGKSLAENLSTEKPKGMACFIDNDCQAGESCRSVSGGGTICKRVLENSNSTP